MIKNLALFLTVLSTSVCAGEKLASTAELRGAAFFPSSSLFKDIYGNVETSYQFEATYPLSPLWAFWDNVDWCNKKGFSTGCTHTSTRIQIATFSAGVKYYLFTGKIYDFYLGLGVIASEINLHNDAEKSLRTFSAGAAFKSGVNILINELFFIDLFFDYHYQPNVYKTHVNMGGIKTGIGLGVYL